MTTPNHAPYTVMSLGGSLVVPDDVNVAFVREFRSRIKAHAAGGMRFYVVVGGGAVARSYQRALSELGSEDSDGHDWVGIEATRLNAAFLARAWGGAPSVITNPTTITPLSNQSSDKSAMGQTDDSVTFVSGWKPGRSSDAAAIEVAKRVGTDRVLNLSDVSHVYTKDPNTHDDAEVLEKLTWEEYLEIIPGVWEAGLKTPFDPVAARDALKHDISVAILGSALDNLEKYLRGEEFEGTTISGS